MAKNCIKFGKWYNSYKYIFLIIIFSLLKDIALGSDNHACFETVKLIEPINISNCFMIRKSFFFLFSIFLSLIFYRIQAKNLGKKEFNQSSKSFEDNDIERRDSEGIELIHNEQKIQIYPNLKLLSIIVLWILEEESISYFKSIMLHLDFWMLELIIVHFLMIKILKKEVYSHQKLMLYFCSLPFILKTITIILSFSDPNNSLDIEKENNRFKYSEEINKFKIIYVAINWLLIVGIFVYLFLISVRSYVNIKIKWLIDLKYISSYKIFFLYNLIGFIFCLFVSLIASFIPCDNISENKDFYTFKDYFCIVHYDNKKYFDNLIFYFTNNENLQDYYLEGISIILGAICFFFYKFFCLKVIEVLSPVYFIFSFPIYYVFNKIYLLFLNYIKNGQWHLDIKFSIIKLILDFTSDIVSIFGYLIYLEIIELHCFKLDFNLKKNILKREIFDVDSTNLDNSIKSVSFSSSSYSEQKPEIEQDDYI